MTSAGCLQEVEGKEAVGRDTCPSHISPVDKKPNTHKKSGLEKDRSLVLNKILVK